MYFKLDTSKFVSTWAMAATSLRKINCPLSGVGSHVTYILNLEPPPVLLSLELVKKEMSNLVCRWNIALANER